MWVSCHLHGDFKVKKTSCPNFKKKVTKLDLLREIRQLKEENEQLRQRIAFFEKQEDEFEQYTAQTIQNMIANYRDD